MNCEDFVDALQAFLDGDMSADEQARVWEHLQSCASCQEVLTGYQWVVHAAHQLKQAPRKSPSSPEGVTRAPGDEDDKGAGS